MTKKRGRKSRKEILKDLIDAGLANNNPINPIILKQYNLLCTKTLSPGEMIKLAKELPLKSVRVSPAFVSKRNRLSKTLSIKSSHQIKKNKKRRKKNIHDCDQDSDKIPDDKFISSYILSGDIIGYTKACQEQSRKMYKREIGSIRLRSLELEEKIYDLSTVNSCWKFEYYNLVLWASTLLQSCSELSTDQFIEKLKEEMLKENTYIFNDSTTSDIQLEKEEQLVDEESYIINMINSYDEKIIHGENYVQKGDVSCPKCHKDDQVNTKTMQTASLDEGHTVYGYCKRCKKPFIKGHK